MYNDSNIFPYFCVTASNNKIAPLPYNIQTINIGETYLIQEFRDILRIGFLFFLRPEPSLIED